MTYNHFSTFIKAACPDLKRALPTYDTNSGYRVSVFRNTSEMAANRIIVISKRLHESAAGNNYSISIFRNTTDELPIVFKSVATVYGVMNALKGHTVVKELAGLEALRNLENIKERRKK